MKTFLNYFGQLRLYSFLDLFIFATAITRDTKYIIGILLLWLSFLLYLEAQHKDRLRLPIKHIAWIIAFLPTFFLLPWKIPLLFGICSVAYTLKKKFSFFGLTSPLFRGFQNFTLAYFFNPMLAIVALGPTFLRNMIGDFRDAGDDKKDSMVTIPIAIGVKTIKAGLFMDICFLCS